MKHIIQTVKSDNLNLVYSVSEEDDSYILKDGDYELTDQMDKFLKNILKTSTNTVINIRSDKTLINNETQIDVRLLVADDFKGEEKKCLVQFVEQNGCKKVIGLKVVSDTFEYDKSNHREVTYQTYESLKEKDLYIQSNLIQIIEDSDQKLTEKNFNLQTLKLLSNDEQLELTKTQEIKRLEQLVLGNLNLETIYYFYKFMFKNNELISNGYFINDINRDEVYLKILNDVNSEDEEVKKRSENVLDILSEYLEAIDKLKKYMSLFSDYENYKKNVYDAESIEEIKKLSEELERIVND